MDQTGYQGGEGEYGNHVVGDAFEMVSDAELRDSGQLPNIHGHVETDLLGVAPGSRA